MNILITGAKGFIGKNLIASLENIRDKKDNIHQINGSATTDNINIYQYDIGSTKEELGEYCRNADFVFHLAGINRPKNQEEFMAGNFGFSCQLLDTLRYYHNTCPIMLSSSIQASIEGRFAESEYGKSKRAGEVLFQEYADSTGAKVLIYRFPNVFGKWCLPNYNSAVATFCYNIAHDMQIQVNDENTKLELVYIDDLIEEMLQAINGNEHSNQDGFCFVPKTFHVTLGYVVDSIKEFKESRDKRTVPNMANEFIYRLYSTYISYLPEQEFSYPLTMNIDLRGSFTEILKSESTGQFSVNITKPGITKGNHWHHSKMEKFVVVSGKGLIQLRRIGIDTDGKLYPVLNYHVSGDKVMVVDIPPGYTHKIVNEGVEDLITFMWSNDCFNKEKPDTFFMEV